MKKEKLITYLENHKPDLSDKNKEFLLQSIVEETELPDMVDIMPTTRKGHITTLPTKEKEPKEHDIAIAKGKVQKGVNLTFPTELGIYTVLMDKEFEKIDDKGKTVLSKMFNEKEIDKILTTDKDKWVPVKRSPILCYEKHLETGNVKAGKILCVNLKVKKRTKLFNTLSKYVTTVYKRLDDDPKNEKKLVFYKGKALNLIPMGSAHENEEIAGLKVSGRKIAVALKLPNKKDPYLFSMTPDTFFYFHEKI